MSKRVLIITYYWPPSAGSGVQRWLKFAKYLPEFGWEPVIFTPENPDFELKDESLVKEINATMEVLKFPIWEPYGIFRKLKKEKIADAAVVLEKSTKSTLDKTGIWLRANALIPDPRIFWVKPSVGFLKELIDQGQFQAIITTGPPHSLHLIGLRLKRKTGIPWLADFRDPWSKWEFLDMLPMHEWARKMHHSLENEVLKEANAIMTISPTFKQDFENISHRKVSLITNGFDSADLPKDFHSKKSDTDTFEILYTGVIDAIRNPIPFLNAMRLVFESKNQKVIMRFVGKISSNVLEYVKSYPWLASHVRMEGYVSHQNVFEYYKQSHLLLLILTDTKNAKGNIPGKIFEYMATGRPIIALGDPDGDSAKIIESNEAGKVFSHSDTVGIQSFLQGFEPKESYMLKPSIENHSRKNLTKLLADLLDEHTDSLS